MKFVLSTYPKNRSRRLEEADKPAICVRNPPPHVGGYGVPAVFRQALSARSVKLLGRILLLGTLLPADAGTAGVPPNILGWSTNGPAVYALVSVPATNPSADVQVPNAGQSAQITNPVFNHFLPGSLDNLVWTNFIAHTNGRDMTIWSTRSHPLDWPAHPPNAAWNTRSLIWGLKGATG